jgi:hypothetical protein
MVWTADLDREKGSLAHMFRNAKRDSTTVVASNVPFADPFRCGAMTRRLVIYQCQTPSTTSEVLDLQVLVDRGL